MPQLKNVKQEILAQGLFAGKTQLQAYQEAGYKGTNTAASTKAANHPDVQARVAELMRERHEAQRMANERALEQESITKSYLVSRLKFLADSSIRGTKEVFDDKGAHVGWKRTAGDGTVAHNCLRTLAQMGGYLIEKVEIGQPGDHARLTDDELRNELISVGESIGLDPKLIEHAIAGEDR
jgi:hypothetical protein